MSNGTPSSRELPSLHAVKRDPASTSTVGNRSLAGNHRSVPAGTEAASSLDSGQRACQGCAELIGARYAIDAAMRATDNQLIAVNATGCFEAFRTPYPGTPGRIPRIHSLLGNAAAVASGVAAAMRIKGRGDVRVVAQGGDGGTADIGFGCLSGMFERNDDVLYVCCDSEACMNTGVQRSSATPPAARTATTIATGQAPGNASGTGKNVPLIAMAHGIPYVATASIANLPDLEAKVTRAMGIHGARYLHVHAPCPLGWGTDPAETIRIAGLAVDTGLFPLFEAEWGEITGRTPIRVRVPVTEYLVLQKRFAHLFGKEPDKARIDLIQALADRNIARFGLAARDDA